MAGRSNSYPRCKRMGHYGICPSGRTPAVFMNVTSHGESTLDEIEDEYDLAMAAIEDMKARSQASEYALERFMFKSA